MQYSPLKQRCQHSGLVQDSNVRVKPMNHYKWHWGLGDKETKEVFIGMCIGVKQSEDNYERT